MLFVTGITGHSGEWFFRRLEQQRYSGKIRCLIRSENHSFMNKSALDIECVYGDLSDMEFLANAMRGVKTILHIASIHKTENVTEAAIRNQVNWLICVHTTGRFSKYKSSSAEYIRIEESVIARRKELDITIVRPTMIYGSSRDVNMYKLIDYLYRHTFFPMFGSGDNLMQPVHAQDLGDAYYSILVNPDTTKNKEYDLSGKKPLSYYEIVNAVSHALNRNTTIIKFPIRLSVLAAKLYCALCKKPKISVEQILRMQEDKAFSYEQASRDFGYNPRSFEDGIREEVWEYLSNKRNNQTP